jgi:hypothetical protein
MQMGYPKSIIEITELKGLISEGNILKDLPESTTVFGVVDGLGLAVPVVSRMDKWMEDGINCIYRFLPETIINADFPEIAHIHNGGQSQIITFIRKERINTILTALKCCLNFAEWLSRFEEKILSPKEHVEFYFVTLEAMVLYIRKELVGLILGLEDGRTIKTALLHLYGRIIQSVHSIVKLNDVICSHLLIASIRGLLELYVDMSLIKNSLIDNGVEKFFFFDKTYRFRSANNLLRIDKEIISSQKESSVLSKFIQNEKQITEKAETLWDKKPGALTHWSDLSLENRSRRAGELKLYRDIYYYGNMYVHSGYVGFDKTEDDAHLLCSYAYSHSTEILKKASDIIFNEITIKQKEEMVKEITGIHYFFGYFHIWKALIKN